jgi:hypothetical protein
VRTGLAVTITECSPVVDSASSEVKPPYLSDAEPLKKRVERILKRISSANSLKTADVVYINIKKMSIFVTFPVPERPIHSTLPGVVISFFSYRVRLRLKLGILCRKSRSQVQLSSLVHFSMIILLTFF